MSPARHGSLRPAWAEVDLAALRRNVRTLAAVSSPAKLCAVVKADAYGHGAAACAVVALEAGASSLAVALVEEGVELRDAGVRAPILLLSEPGGDAMLEAVARGLTPTVYSPAGVRSAVSAARRAARDQPVGVHVAVDTGMHRVGAAPIEVGGVAAGVDGAAELSLDGIWTHLAVAEDLDDPFTGEQVGVFSGVLHDLERAGIEPPLVHAANSAGAIGHPAARFGMVRCGIALYGYAPSVAVAESLARSTGSALEPVLSLHARVTHLQRLDTGERISYGRLYEVRRPTVVATVPLGYADGVPRGLFRAGAEVLVGGRRSPVAGAVTMDQILVDCGPDSPVEAGDEVVLLGEQRGERISAEEWSRRLGTISYEVLSGIGPRVPRVPVG